MRLHIYFKSGSHMIISATSGIRDGKEWIELYEYSHYTPDNAYYLKLDDIEGVYEMNPTAEYCPEKDYHNEVDYFKKIFGELFHWRRYDDVKQHIYKYCNVIA